MGADLNAFRTRSLETWETVSEGWEKRNEWMAEATRPINDWIVRVVDPHAGQTVIDIAAGPGDLGFRIADLVGRSGRLLCTDFSPAMLEVAKRQGAARGLENVEYRVMDAERMDLDDDCVDVAVCRWGYMLMADPLAALRESRRILRDGGPLAFVVWGAPERNPWASVPAMTLIERGHMPPPEPGMPGIFALADPALLGRLVVDAGFEPPAIEEISFAFHYDDADDLWDALIGLAGPLAGVIGALPEGDQIAIREAVVEGMAEHRNEDGSYDPPAVCWGVLAR